MRVMTNADYIKKQLARLTDIELAAIVYEYFGIKTSNRIRPKILKAAWKAFDKWTNSVGNKTNFVKDDGSTPSIWAWERWRMLNGKWENKGRTIEVALQVWLTMKYNKEEWEND